MAYPPSRRLITPKEEFGRHLWEIPAARDFGVLLLVGLVYVLRKIFTPLDAEYVARDSDSSLYQNPVRRNCFATL